MSNRDIIRSWRNPSLRATKKSPHHPAGELNVRDLRQLVAHRESGLGFETAESCDNTSCCCTWVPKS